MNMGKSCSKSMLAAFVVDVKFEKNGHITRGNEKKLK
jgi:hypothetical protein